MTRIKDPKQVASTIRQILFILITSSSAGFMALSCLRGPGCPGGAPGAQERGPRGRRGAEPGRSRAGLGSAREEDRVGFAATLGAPSPGQGCGRRRSCSEVRRCVDPPTARSGSSCCSCSALRRRLHSCPRPPLPPRWPGGWGASGDGGAAAAAAALAAVAMGRAPSLLSKGYFIALQ